MSFLHCIIRVRVRRVFLLHDASLAHPRPSTASCLFFFFAHLHSRRAPGHYGSPAGRGARALACRYIRTCCVHQTSSMCASGIIRVCTSIHQFLPPSTASQIESPTFCSSVPWFSSRSPCKEGRSARCVGLRIARSGVAHCGLSRIAGSRALRGSRGLRAVTQGRRKRVHTFDCENNFCVSLLSCSTYSQ